MKKLFKWMAIIFIGFIVLGIIGGILGEDSTETVNTDAKVNDDLSEQRVVAESSEQAETGIKEAVKEEAQSDDLSRPQKNAVRTAKQYISMSGFSRDGLIEQLSSEYGNGYEVADATIAVDSLDIDWNEQAVRTAKQYLEMSGFSCDGLIEQLSSEYGNKYTVSEATYGAQQAGACS